jgi:uncharacterized membrane protein
VQLFSPMFVKLFVRLCSRSSALCSFIHLIVFLVLWQPMETIRLALTSVDAALYLLPIQLKLQTTLKANVSTRNPLHLHMLQRNLTPSLDASSPLNT